MKKPLIRSRHREDFKNKNFENIPNEVLEALRAETPESKAMKAATKGTSKGYEEKT